MFKKTILSAAVAAILSVGAMSAQAADTGFYASAGIGQSRVSEGAFDANDFAFKIGGGYQFMKNFAVEAEYLDGGNPEDGGVEVDDYTVYSLLVKGTMPITDKIDAFAKVGLGMWDVSAGRDSDGTDFAYAFGGEYKFNDKLSAGAEYYRVDVGSVQRVDYMGATVAYRF